MKRGRGTLFGLILGFSSQTSMSLTCYLGRVRVGGGTPPDASFSFFLPQFHDADLHYL